MGTYQTAVVDRTRRQSRRRTRRDSALRPVTLRIWGPSAVHYWRTWPCCCFGSRSAGGQMDCRPYQGTACCYSAEWNCLNRNENKRVSKCHGYEFRFHQSFDSIGHITEKLHNLLRNPWANQSINQSMHQSINKPVNQSIDRTIKQSINRSVIHQSINQVINVPIHQRTSQSINRSSNPSMKPTKCPQINYLKD